MGFQDSGGNGEGRHLGARRRATGGEKYIVVPFPTLSITFFGSVCIRFGGLTHDRPIPFLRSSRIFSHSRLRACKEGEFEISLLHSSRYVRPFIMPICIWGDSKGLVAKKVLREGQERNLASRLSTSHVGMLRILYCATQCPLSRLHASAEGLAAPVDDRKGRERRGRYELMSAINLSL